MADATGTTRERVREAFAAHPRPTFLPPRVRDDADFDGPLPIGHGQTNSQPTTVGNMLVLLDVHPGDRVLDVGSGSGWTTALLAHLAGERGSVLGLERVPELCAIGADNLAASMRAAPAGQAPAEIRQASEGVLGAPDEPPFDRILVSAEARALPTALVDQLAPGGVMMIPVAGVMLRIARDAAGHVTTTEHGYYRFVPLL